MFELITYHTSLIGNFRNNNTANYLWKEGKNVLQTEWCLIMYVYIHKGEYRELNVNAVLHILGKSLFSASGITALVIMKDYR